MTRSLSEYADQSAEQDLERLLSARGNPAVYRQAMRRLGERLGRVLRAKIKDSDSVLLVCTVEDADYLVQGIVEELEPRVRAGQFFLACFWNDRKKVGQGSRAVSVAPIIGRYVEPFGNASVDTVIVAKSIISGACVVRTNLTEILDHLEPKRILVAAPVMHEDAPRRLSQEFPESTSSKFEYIYFALDSEKRDGNVVPGVGGNVYELLGLGDQTAKNRIWPDLVKRRQLELA